MPLPQDKGDSCFSRPAFDRPEKKGNGAVMLVAVVLRPLLRVLHVFRYVIDGEELVEKLDRPFVFTQPLLGCVLEFCREHG